MSTIAQKLLEIQNVKDTLKANLINKGIDVSGHTFLDMAADVNSITSGTGGTLTINPSSLRYVKLTESVIEGDVIYELENILSSGNQERVNGLENTPFNTYNDTSAFSQQKFVLSKSGNFILILNTSFKFQRYIWDETLGEYIEDTCSTDVALPSAATRMVMSDDGSKVCVTTGTSPNTVMTYVYNSANSTYEKKDDPSPSTTGSSLTMSGDGNTLALLNNVGNKLHTYKWSNINDRFEETNLPNFSYQYEFESSLALSYDGSMMICIYTSLGTNKSCAAEWNATNERYEYLTTGLGYGFNSSIHIVVESVSGLSLSNNKEFFVILPQGNYVPRWFKWNSTSSVYEELPSIDEPMTNFEYYVNGVVLSPDGLRACISVGTSPWLLPYEYNSTTNKFEALPLLTPESTVTTNILFYGSGTIMAGLQASPYYIAYRDTTLQIERTGSKLSSPTIIPSESISIGYAKENGAADDIKLMNSIWWNADPWADYPPPQQDTLVTDSDISGISVPTVGVAKTTSIDDTQYTGTITWSPISDPSDYSTIYTATVTLTPKTGYTFNGLPSNFFTANGSTSVTNNANSGVVTIVYPETASLTLVTDNDISGISVPTVGLAKTTTVDDTQYTGTITWSPASDPSDYSTIYTATVTLTPKAGYTFNGLPSNFFTASGSTTVTNNANSGVVTIVYPETASLTLVTDNDITGIAQPTLGVAKTTSIDDTQYTGTITWSPTSDPSVELTIYTATVTLTPKTGYTFDGLPSNFFTAANSTSVTNDANSGVVTIVYPETASLTVINDFHIEYPQPVTGGTLQSTIVNTQYTATMNYDNWDSTVQPNKIYTGHFTLIPQSGYKFGILSGNDFTMDGATTLTNNSASNPGSVLVNFAFAITDKIIISNFNISGLSVPTSGGTPDLNITNDSEWTGGSVVWSPTPNGTFDYGQIYVASVIITPTANYKFGTITSNMFSATGQTSAVTTDNGDGTVTVSITYPATASLTQVNRNNLYNIIAPVADVLPITYMSDDSQWTAGSIVWTPTPNYNTNHFDYYTQYQANVILTPASGYTFTGLPSNFFNVPSDAESVTMSVDGSGVATVVVTYPLTAERIIDDFIIKGLSKPVQGVTQDNTIDASTQYTLQSINWSPNDNPYLPDVEYTGTLTLSPKTGYTFTGVPANSFVTDSPSDYKTISNPVNSGVVTIVYQNTEPLVITDLDISGISQPVRGVAKTTSIDDTQYTGSITWSPTSDPSEPLTTYVATVTLTPKQGYTFTGVLANSFTAANSSNVTNSADSNVVTIVYPETEAIPMTDNVIGGIAQPYASASVGTSISNNTEFTLDTMTWSPADSTFALNTIYTATLELLPEIGYSFKGVASDFFSEPNATSVTTIDNGDGTATVNIVYPKTEESYFTFDVPTQTITAYDYARGGANPVVPSTLSNVDVLHIGDYSMYGDNINSIDIPSSVISIGDSAFSDISTLAYVTLHEGLQTIGVEAFYNGNLNGGLIIPNSVTSIGERCFQNCTNLINVTIGSGLTTIPSQAFYNTNVGTITIPSNITTINQGAFQNTAMFNITIGSNVTINDTGSGLTMGSNDGLGFITLYNGNGKLSGTYHWDGSSWSKIA